MTTLKSIARLLLCLAVCLGIGAVGALSTKPEIAGWYSSLVKPSWTPPPAVFPVAWTALYIMIAVAFWRLWDRAAPSTARTRAMVLFVAQLALNAAWSPVFFGSHAVWSALAIIALMVFLIAATIVAARRNDRVAAWLLVPYLCWVVYATTINAGVAVLN